MALQRTSLAGGCAATDTEVLLTAITGVTVGSQFTIDGEAMRVVYVGLSATNPVGVYRGIRGTNVIAHPAGASVVIGAPSEFGTQAKTKATRRDVVSYSANGVIGNPTPGRDMVAILNGTTALTTLTIANPSKDNDGDMLIIVSGGKAAHVITYTSAGLGGRGASVLTFSAVAEMSVALVAYNETWILLGASSGAGSVAASTVIT